MLHTNITRNAAGHLCFAGFDTLELAKEFGTPAYLLDGLRLRDNCRKYTESMHRAFGPDSQPFYASKALCFAGIYPILKEMGMGVDVVSGGELYTALKAGFPAGRICFHGNSKTDAEIRFAVDQNIGWFVVDNREELEVLGAYAAACGKVQNILLRVTPGIDPHTFAAVNTGKLDCQFGSPMETGQALAITELALKTPGVCLQGFHCHIGSQIFDWVPFRDGAEKMLLFLQEVKAKLGFCAKILNLGGGFGVAYVDSDPRVDIPRSIDMLGQYLRSRCAELELEMPRVFLEPGRSIVADAGMTLYRVSSIKTIEGHRSYVCVDGGMSDNPRYALYQSPYTVYHAESPAAGDFLCTLAGRCCESGALLQENILLPRPKRGDVLAVACTGAYNYSMASNYNRVGRPPIILLEQDGPRVAVRRESWEDMLAREI